MEKAILFLAHLINYLHDLVVDLSDLLGLGLTDKELHFWLMGLIGIAIFVVTDVIFKYVGRWHISVISFIYTFTVLLVIAFGLEIEQKITGRGAMEFADVVAGLWGFIVVFSAFMVIKAILYLTKRLIKKFISKAR
ncbi:MAG: hypothetical protein GX949_02050 [Peptococcaceae bacterium]|nr:hypothetical protein [Peptococcaceae bacterium]